ncbi:2,5-diamino-6-(ribosylamino)-4(3H)-pyrimidinone 5'-phosphate reductase [Methanothermobacter sp. KEPCO-1]|uniref:2,5-diamino-6-(ribosylamino)-4(3H)-pyrimidinone 5'-phosphate reductase n=1 Tax=Methanothermobacter marburgensis (strain ATCC BAA-927 / DSM 2133 / JCM 14651 / NBRC 100331 / OCM 82 / Marburg) TaxID=79929 RepID=D9PVN1_METTM|nr:MULTISPECIES: 2,5-diamino-6-(ribosylamino)-4(3H)-pyrimidinone 5'-phosphate reductase [Methanothermobacter]ADL58279.1 predicted 2,5-diamino-6-hydroxy-4-(5-phosphoribosylamino)pyrimidine 1-reductase [Methanothermobacter marburgensis str. Marburg]QEF93878.1 2,5-diamino-6-(ribosylamino)-4(3H)-pyrimidinone 5'-phosphate reductase [Methanothermobacter sp. KEPCO-1]WBF10440.1 2,5-diamino-6-(ribosylamino)-4(3H)-pyrimidinone 5'-phosphate reductase [Methanothermobacter marburgensis]
MRPYVILNAAMTLDGKIATKTGSSEISGEEDLRRVHELRRECDAIMVGINTVLADDPRLTVHRVDAEEGDNPVRVVVDSRARTPLNFRVLNDEAPTVIGVSESAPASRVNELRKRAEVVVAGKERVNLCLLLERLHEMGVRRLMLEGGSTLNYSMLTEGLVDEVRVCIAPMIAGGREARTLVDGEGIDDMSDAIKLELERFYTLGEDLIVEYTVKR